MQIEKAQELIDIEGNYNLQRLKYKADPTLAHFIQENMSIKQSNVLYQRLRRLYGNNSKFINLFDGNNEAECLDHIKNVVISFLLRIDEMDTQRRIHNVKMEAIENGKAQIQIHRKKAEIMNKELYQHVALHFLMYFCKKNFAKIYEQLKTIREKIKFQIQQQGQIFDQTVLPQVDFPFNIKNKFQCYCQMDSALHQRYKLSIQDILRCNRCFSPYHSACQANLLHCATCNLQLSSHKSKIKDKYSLFYVYPHKFINTISFEIPDHQQEQSKAVRKHNFEIRVNRVDSTNQKDPCSAVFINKYQVILNGEIVKVKKYNLKAGESIRISNHYLSKHNVLVIKKNLKQNVPIDKISNGPTFLVGVFKVSQTACKAKPKQITMQQSKILLNNAFKVIKDSLIKVSLIDINSNEKIKTPVRGQDCKHFSCFDWKGFEDKKKEEEQRNAKTINQLRQKQKSNRLQQQSTSDITQSRSVKQSKQNLRLVQTIKKSQKTLSKCPICQQPIHFPYIDPLMSKILQQSLSKHKSVFIKSDGSYYPEEQNQTPIIKQKSQLPLKTSQVIQIE